MEFMVLRQKNKKKQKKHDIHACHARVKMKDPEWVSGTYETFIRTRRTNSFPPQIHTRPRKGKTGKLKTKPPQSLWIWSSQIASYATKNTWLRLVLPASGILEREREANKIGRTSLLYPRSHLITWSLTKNLALISTITLDQMITDQKVFFPSLYIATFLSPINFIRQSFFHPRFI